MAVGRLFTDEQAYAYAVSQWLRDTVHVAAEAYVSGHGTLEQTFRIVLAEAERRAEGSDISADIWRNVAERDLTLAIQRMEAAAHAAERAIRLTVAPLFDQCASPETIEAAARVANDDTMAWQQVLAILASEFAWFRTRSGRRSRSRR